MQDAPLTFTYSLNGYELHGEFEPYDDTPVFGPPTLNLHWLHLTVLEVDDGDGYRVISHERILTTRKPSEITLLAAATQFVRSIGRPV